MDWKLFATTLATVFFAELGDKTQLAALGLASGTRGRWVVFVAASLALVLSTAIAVAAADGIARVVSPLTVKRASGALFIVLGAWTLWSAKA
ncbi:MAG: TMEM165/GDT1 family protein [Polyangiales bacterium]